MKGINKSLEAIIAIIAIAGAFLIMFGRGERLPEMETVTWKLIAFNALDFLENNGSLSKYGVNNDATTIENLLKDIIPASLEYKVVICGTTCPNVNIKGEKVISVVYLIAGTEENLEPKRVLLYLWRET